MPFWPFYMLAVAGLAFWGYRAGAWIAPVLLLVGLILTRMIVWTFEPALFEVSACTLWLCIGFALMYNCNWVAGFFAALSGLSYGVLLVAGLRIEYIGVLPIVADVFFWLAFLSVGGGLVAGNRHPASVDAGFPDRPLSAAVVLAQSVARDPATVAQRAEIGYSSNSADVGRGNGR
jgi:hypothetical protein